MNTAYILNKISPREKEVLHLIAYEYTTDMIADKLYISHHTVISHRKNLLEKLDVRNVAGMVRRGFELGYLDVQVGGTIL
ncbi:MAG: helix-turn-helix transcriptional regulator [Saprospiraceae bacterium]